MSYNSILDFFVNFFCISVRYNLALCVILWIHYHYPLGSQVIPVCFRIKDMKLLLGNSGNGFIQLLKLPEDLLNKPRVSFRYGPIP